MVAQARRKPPSDFIKNRRRAHALLACVAVLYLLVSMFAHLRMQPDVTLFGLQLQKQLSLLPVLAFDAARAVLEAALIGGLADWFAVHALFHHIPIPILSRHTQLIVRAKSKIGAQIGAFVVQHLLCRKFIHGAFLGKDPTLVAAQWMQRPENSAFLAKQILHALPAVAGALQDTKVLQFLQDTLREEWQTLDPAKYVQKWARDAMATEGYERVVYHIAIALRGVVQRQRDTLENRIQSDMPWLMRQALGDSVAHKVATGLEKWAEALGDPNSPERATFDQSLKAWIVRLKPDSADAQGLRSIFQGMLDDLAAGDGLQYMWQKIIDLIENAAQQAQLAEKNSKGGQYHDSQKNGMAVRMLQIFAKHLANTPDIRQKLNSFAENRLITFAEHPSTRHFVAGHLQAYIESWNDKNLVETLEPAVGKDLQLIRINGTVLGGILGGFLFALHQVLPMLMAYIF